MVSIVPRYYFLVMSNINGVKMQIKGLKHDKLLENPHHYSNDSHCRGLNGLYTKMLKEVSNMLWVVDYTNPCAETLDCLIVEAKDSYEAYEVAVQELKNLHIPKRYLIRLERFE